MPVLLLSYIMWLFTLKFNLLCKINLIMNRKMNVLLSRTNQAIKAFWQTACSASTQKYMGLSTKFTLRFLILTDTGFVYCNKADIQLAPTELHVVIIGFPQESVRQTSKLLHDYTTYTRLVKKYPCPFSSIYFH